MTTPRDHLLGIVSIVLTVLNCIGVFVFVGGMLYLRPKFMAIYADLGAALPYATRLVIVIPGGLVLFLGLIVAGLLVAKEFIPRKAVPLVINLSWSVIAIVMSVFAYWVLTAPLVALMEEM